MIRQEANFIADFTPCLQVMIVPGYGMAVSQASLVAALITFVVLQRIP